MFIITPALPCPLTQSTKNQSTQKKLFTLCLAYNQKKKKQRLSDKLKIEREKPLWKNWLQLNSRNWVRTPLTSVMFWTLFEPLFNSPQLLRRGEEEGGRCSVVGTFQSYFFNLISNRIFSCKFSLLVGLGGNKELYFHYFFSVSPPPHPRKCHQNLNKETFRKLNCCCCNHPTPLRKVEHFFCHHAEFIS